jgi:hypothetical protein
MTQKLTVEQVPLPLFLSPSLFQSLRLDYAPTPHGAACNKTPLLCTQEEDEGDDEDELTPPEEQEENQEEEEEEEQQ